MSRGRRTRRTAVGAARLTSSRAARTATTAGLHAFGAYGISREMVVERLDREVFFELTQGVSKIRQIIVGRELLADAERRAAR